MKFPEWLRVYGDTKYRGPCPQESAEQVTFFGRVRTVYPLTYGRIALHPRNEGKRSYGQVWRQKAEGMADGAVDIVIPTGFACELKRLDHTVCRWQDNQLEYLEAVHNMGGFACVALGWEAAWEALHDWIKYETASSTR